MWAIAGAAVPTMTVSALLRPGRVCVGIPFNPYAGVWGWARLSATPLWLPSFVGAVFVVLFPLVCRGVTCNILLLLRTCTCTCTCTCLGARVLLVVLCGSLLAYILLCLRQHIRVNAGGIPFAPYASGCVGVGMFSRIHLWVTFVDIVIVVLFIVCRSAACNVLFFVFVYVVLSLGCAWPSPYILHIILSHFLSLYIILPFRSGGGLVVLSAACMYGHTFRSLCVRRAGVGMVTPLGGVSFCMYASGFVTYLALPAAAGLCECGHTFHSLCGPVGAGMALGYTSLVTFIHWRGYHCAFSACVPRHGMQHTCTCVGARVLLVAVCGSLLAYILLCLQRHIRANSGGIPCAPYVSRRAGAGMFSRLHVLVTFVGVVIVVLFTFSLRSVAQHVTYLHLCPGGRCGCFFCMFGLCFVFFDFVCCTFSWLCVVPSMRSSYHSFTLRVPPYHFAFPRRCWPCWACGGMYVQGYLSLPMCAACGGGHGHSITPLGIPCRRGYRHVLLGGVA